MPLDCEVGVIGALFGEEGAAELEGFGLYPASRTIERGKKMRRVIMEDTKHPRPATIVRKSVTNLDTPPEDGQLAIGWGDG